MSGRFYDDIMIRARRSAGHTSVGGAMARGNRVWKSLTSTGSVYAGRPNPIEALVVTATPSRATQLSLAVLLGAAEDVTSRQTWRDPSAENRTYFAALRGWGYPLSPVELLVLADADASVDQPQHATSDGGTEGGADGEVGATDSEALDGAPDVDTTAAEDTSTD